jgi:hypothetical protein
MKTKLTQRRFKAQKSSAWGLCKPWKKGGEDKKTVGQLRKAQDADQQLKEVSLQPHVWKGRSGDHAVHRPEVWSRCGSPQAISY